MLHLRQPLGILRLWWVVSRLGRCGPAGFRTDQAVPLLDPSGCPEHGCRRCGL